MNFIFSEYHQRTPLSQWELGRVVLLTTLLFIVFVSASFAQTLTKTYDSDTKMITLKSSGTTVFSAELLENTDQCLTYCWSKIRIYTSNGFTTPSSSNSEYSWKFYDKFRAENNFDNNAKMYLIKNKTITYPNGKSVIIEEEVPIVFWGRTFSSGYHTIKIYLVKPINKNIDWVPTFRGFNVSEWAWWNTSFKMARNVTLTENKSLIRINDPVHVFFDFSSSINKPVNCTTELRMVNNNSIEIDSDVYNETYSGGSCQSATVGFLANLSANQIVNYTLYWNNTLAPNPDYKQVIYEDFNGKRSLSNRWANTCTTPLQNSSINMSNCNLDALIRPYNSSIIYETRLNMTEFPSSSGEVWGMNNGTANDNVVFGTSGTNVGILLLETRANNQANRTITGTPSTNEVFNIYRFNWSNVSVGFYINNGLNFTVLNSDTGNGITMPPFNFSLQNFGFTFQTTNNRTIQIDYVSAYSLNPINHTLQAEEQKVTASNIRFVPSLLYNRLSNCSVTILGSGTFSKSWINITLPNGSIYASELIGTIPNSPTDFNGTTINSSLFGRYTCNVLVSDGANSESGSATGFIKSIMSDNQTTTNITHEVFNEVFNISTEWNDVVDVNATLFWNNTYYPYSTKLNSGNEKWNFTRNLQIPIKEINNTINTFYWNFTARQYNGSHITNQTGNFTQTILFSYNLTNTTHAAEVLEFGTFEINATIYNVTDIATVTVKTQFNESNATAAVFQTIGNNTKYNSTRVAPILTSANSTLSITTWFNVSLNGTSRLRFINSTINITSFQITDCNANLTTVTTARFLGFSENATTDKVNITLELQILAFLTPNRSTYKQFNFNIQTANDTHRFCLYPINTTVQTDLDYITDAFGYTPKRYTTFNTTLNNVSTDFSTYVLLNGLSSINPTNGLLEPITVRVVQGVQDPVPDVTVVTKREFLGAGTFFTVASPKTDSNGEVAIFLQPNEVRYQFSVFRNGTLLKTFEPTYIQSGVEKILKLDTSVAGDYWTVKNKISANCFFINDTNTTGNLRCEATDTSGATSNYCLYVDRFIVTGARTVVSDQCLSGSSGVVLTVNLTSIDTTIYGFTFSVRYPNSEITLKSGSIDQTKPELASQAGPEGLFYLMILTMVIFFASIYNPAVGTFSLFVSLLFSRMLGIHSLSVTFILVVGLFVGMIFYKMRS